eukprot:358534-Chlamydomonas_euryale.AAC.5
MQKISTHVGDVKTRGKPISVATCGALTADTSSACTNSGAPSAFSTGTADCRSDFSTLSNPSTPEVPQACRGFVKRLAASIGNTCMSVCSGCMRSAIKRLHALVYQDVQRHALYRASYHAKRHASAGSKTLNPERVEHVWQLPSLRWNAGAASITLKPERVEHVWQLPSLRWNASVGSKTLNPERVEHVWQPPHLRRHASAGAALRMVAVM